MGPKTFKRIVDHLFPIRDQFRDRPYAIGMAIASDYWGRSFDYPDYGDLPKSISNFLSPEAVDAMQDILQDKHDRKRDFARAYRDRLKDLGEPGDYGKGIK